MLFTINGVYTAVSKCITQIVFCVFKLNNNEIGTHVPSKKQVE